MQANFGVMVICDIIARLIFPPMEIPIGVITAILGAPIFIVMVLHDLNLASEYCNKIVLLNAGEIFKDGAPRKVLTYQNIETVYKTVVVYIFA